MFKFKGRYYFKQYLPMKPVKLDIKLLALRDSETGAVLKYILESLTMGILAGLRNVVMTLLEPLLGKGHVVNMGNYYTSPDLVAELKISGTGVTGSVRANQKHLAPNIKTVFKWPQKGRRTT